MVSGTVMIWYDMTILMCAQKLTDASLIYRTGPKTKTSKIEKLKKQTDILRRNGAGQETTESVRKREGSLGWKWFVEQEGFEPVKQRRSDGWWQWWVSSGGRGGGCRKRWVRLRVVVRGCRREAGSWFQRQGGDFNGLSTFRLNGLKLEDKHRAYTPLKIMAHTFYQPGQTPIPGGKFKTFREKITTSWLMQTFGIMIF